MTAEEALERIRARWRRSTPRRQDVEERAAVRLESDPDRELRVLELVSPQVGRHVRLCVRVEEEDKVRWPKKRGERPILIRGWHSGYVHELGDVDRILAGLGRRLDEAGRKARKAAS